MNGNGEQDTGYYNSAHPELRDLLKKVPLRTAFSVAAQQEVSGLSVPEADANGKHKDYTHIPLITIDPETARDFDDAVYAEPDETVDEHGHKTNPGGMKLVVGIADVAHYVRYLKDNGEQSVLNMEALEIGNSTYPPNGVIPMLPEALSNELCSLKPEENRASMLMHITIDANGEIIDKELKRGIMRSRARLTYRQAQDAKEGSYDATTEPVKQHIDNLFKAYEILDKARVKRRALNLEAEQLHIQKSFEDNATVIVKGDRLDSQKLIEEMMIAANVCAAQIVSQNVFRVHEKPPLKNVINGLQMLRESGVQNLPEAEDLRTQEDFNNLIGNLRDQLDPKAISDILVRMQSKAKYSTDNTGHFGLALAAYAHFTSPIRRYPDVLVHRALIDACGLGDDGLHPDEVETLEKMAAHTSDTEIRSAMIERVESQQLLFTKLATKQGELLEAEIYTISPTGLGIKLPGGIRTTIPFEDLQQGRSYERADDGHCIYSEKTGREYHIGDKLGLIINEVDTTYLNFSYEIDETLDSQRAANQDYSPSLD